MKKYVNSTVYAGIMKVYVKLKIMGINPQLFCDHVILVASRMHGWIWYRMFLTFNKSLKIIMKLKTSDTSYNSFFNNKHVQHSDDTSHMEFKPEIMYPN